MSTPLHIINRIIPPQFSMAQYSIHVCIVLGRSYLGQFHPNPLLFTFHGIILSFFWFSDFYAKDSCHRRQDRFLPFCVADPGWYLAIILFTLGKFFYFMSSPNFYNSNSYELMWTKLGWVTLWAIISQTHLVTLSGAVLLNLQMHWSLHSTYVATNVSPGIKDCTFTNLQTETFKQC
jgi:hypothetical protein